MATLVVLLGQIVTGNAIDQRHPVVRKYANRNSRYRRRRKNAV
jgi:hypothetical protein